MTEDEKQREYKDFLSGLTKPQLIALIESRDDQIKRMEADSKRHHNALYGVHC